MKLQELYRKAWTIIVLLMIFIPLLYFYIEAIKKEKMTKNCSRYTVATVYKVSKEKSTYVIFFKFKLNNGEFKGEESTKRKLTILSKFIVRFSCKNPDTHMILLDYNVTHSSLIAPLTGWDTIPSLR